MNARVLSFLTTSFLLLAIMATSLHAMESQHNSNNYKPCNPLECLKRLLYMDMGDGSCAASLSHPQMGNTHVMKSNVNESGYNRVYTEQNELPLKTIEHVQRLMGNISYSWWVSSDQDQVTDSLIKNGFVHDGLEFVMILDLRTCNLENIKTKLRSLLQILDDQTMETTRSVKKVISDDELNLWITISAQGFGIGQRNLDSFVKYIKRNTKRSSFYIASLHRFTEYPVATGLMIIHENSLEKIATLHHVSTLPFHRKKGFATLLSVTAIEDAQKAGCSKMILLAPPMAHGLYLELGFDSYETYDTYIKPDEGWSAQFFDINTCFLF